MTSNQRKFDIYTVKMSGIASQPQNFYIRLNSSNPPEKSSYFNTVTKFENKLFQPIRIEDYKLAITDLHIRGELEMVGLRNFKDFKFTLVETIPSRNNLWLYRYDKYHSMTEISEMLERYFDIEENWQYKSENGYTTRIITPLEQKDAYIMVKTDFVIRTDLSSFLSEVDKIAAKNPTSGLTIPKAKAKILDELKNYEETEDNNVLFEYYETEKKLSGEEFSKLINLRIRELKAKESLKKKQELVAKELKKYPETQAMREVEPMNLKTFLEYVRATLNTHPLYQFFSWNYELIPDKNKYNIVLDSNRSYSSNFDKPYILLFKFSEKAKKLLQRNTTTINPLISLKNLNVEKVISVDYPSDFSAYVETTFIAHSIYGNRLKRVLKTIQLSKNNKNNKVTYSQHYPYPEWHNSGHYNLISAIGIMITDASGNEERW